MRIETIIIITLIAMMLVLTGCARSNALTGNGSAETEDIEADTIGDSATYTPETPVDTTTEEPIPEVFTNVTEAPVYSDVANTCKEDNKGVVRVFDSTGTKKVYRNTCASGLLTKHNCVNNTLVVQNTRCPIGCKTTPYGAVCLDAPLPVHKPVTGPPPTSD